MASNPPRNFVRFAPSKADKSLLVDIRITLMTRWRCTLVGRPTWAMARPYCEPYGPPLELVRAIAHVSSGPTGEAAFFLPAPRDLGEGRQWPVRARWHVDLD